MQRFGVQVPDGSPDLEVIQGVGQLVAYFFWKEDRVGSSPTILTNTSVVGSSPTALTN